MKRLLFLVLLIAYSATIRAQEGTIILNNEDEDEIPCYVVGLDNSSVSYTVDGSTEKKSIKIPEIKKIVFDAGTYTFDENNKLIVDPRSRYLPKSKYKVSTVGVGKYTLHGKAYKGPMITTYTEYEYAGDDYFELKGILVRVK